MVAREACPVPTRTSGKREADKQKPRHTVPFDQTSGSA
jgi:hypothetical protein